MARSNVNHEGFFPDVSVTIDEFVGGQIEAYETVSKSRIQIPVYDKRRIVSLDGKEYDTLHDSETGYCPTCVRKMTVEDVSFKGQDACLKLYTDQIVEDGTKERLYNSVDVPVDSFVQFIKANGLNSETPIALKGRELDVFSVYHENGQGPEYKGIAIRTSKK